MKALTMPSLPRPDKSQLLLALLVFFVLIFAAFSGAVAALGSKFLLLPIFFLIGAAVFAVTPARLSLWGLALACLLVEGPVIYFLKFEFFRWFPPIFAMAMFLPLLLHLMHRKPDAHALQGTPPFAIWLILFLITLMFSTLISQPNMGELLTSWRDYLAFWPVMLLLFTGVFSELNMLRMWRFILMVAALQLPVAFYQHFFVASKSTWGSSWDAVVGTFPGNADGGGSSAAMAIYVLIAVVVAMALWQRGKMRTWVVAALGVASVGTMMFAEVKAAVLMIPIALTMLYANEILRRPLQTLVMVLGGGLIMATIFMGYSKMYYEGDFAQSTVANNPRTPIEAVMNQLDPESARWDGRELSRAGMLTDWWDRTVVTGDFQHSVFGYGIGATTISRLGIGELVLKFRYAIDRISSSLLLWETGLLGHGLFLVMILSAWRSANRLRKVSSIPQEHQALLHASAVAMLIFALTLPYKNFLFKTPPSQFLMVFILGYIGYWYRRVQVMRREAGSTGQSIVSTQNQNNAL